MAREHGAAFLQLYLRCDEAAALSRNMARPPASAAPPEVITRMAATLEAPASARSPPWDRQAIVVEAGAGSGDSPDVAAVWRAVEAAWGPPAPPPPDQEAAAAAKAASQQATAASLVHAVDLACRQAISAAMQRLAGAPAAQRAAAAQQLNQVRQQHLARVRQQQAAEGDRERQQLGEGGVEAAVQEWNAAFQRQAAGCLPPAN